MQALSISLTAFLPLPTLPHPTRPFFTKTQTLIFYVFLDAYAFLILDPTMITNCNLELCLVFFLVIHLIKKAINICTYPLIGFLFLVTLHLMKIIFSFKSQLPAATNSTEHTTSNTSTMPLLFSLPVAQSPPTSPMSQPNSQLTSQPSFTRPSPITSSSQPTQSPSSPA